MNHSDLVFFGVLMTGLLAVLTFEHRRAAAGVSPLVPNVPVNKNPRMYGTDGPLRDANLPLWRPRDDVLPDVAMMGRC